MKRHSATLSARGVDYKVAILDDGLDTDPTLLVFRGDEEEAVVTAHLDPESPCGERGHAIVRPPDDDKEPDDGLVLIAGVLYDAETLEEA